MLVKEQSFTNKEPKTIVIIMQYAAKSGNYFLSPIETYRVNKRRKRHFALDFKIEANTLTKTEFSKYVSY
jgi:hypothetical protein